MLEQLRIRGLGVIGDAVLELGPGLTVLTGETGAGKTMVVTGLGLLLGARGDAGTVRDGEQAALVEGLLAVEPDDPVLARAREAGAVVDEGTLVVARSVSAEGRSRAHLGGRAVPVGLLAELAPLVVAVHGQADQMRLLSPAQQRDLLDRYAGAELAGPHTAYVEQLGRLRAVEAELDDVTLRGRERAEEADRLRRGLDEVASVAPQPGEETVLLGELARLTHADTLREAAEGSHRLLTGDSDPGVDRPSVAGLLAAAAHDLEPGAELDPSLSELRARVAELGYLAVDIGAELSSYASSVEADPTRLAVAQERLATLRTLVRRYGAEAPAHPGQDGSGRDGRRDDGSDAVLAWAQDAAARLLDLDDDGSRGERLRAQREAQRSDLAQQAALMSAARTAAGHRLAELVQVELTALAMPHARLEVAVTQRAAEGGLDLGGPSPLAFGAHGVDDVELLLAPHSGSSPRALGKGASGGELSRVMLALEVVLAGADPVPTLVFDEVDAGVGGRAAVEIGRRLARLAEQAQVLVVTHLPQVAAYADQHLVVTKSEDGSVTESGVQRLDVKARVRELARMLAGQEDSDAAQAHAEELLAAAGEEQAARRATVR